MTQTAHQRSAWLSSVGMHVVVLLLLLLWGRLQPPMPLPRPEPIRLTLVDQPTLAAQPGAPGPALRPQQKKGPAHAQADPAAKPVVAQAPKQQSPERSPTRAVAPKVTKQPTNVQPAAKAEPRPVGDYKAALAQRQAELQAQEKGRLAKMGGSGPALVQGTGGGDAGTAGGDLSGRQLIHDVRPTYPHDALRDQVGGRVVIAIVVAPDGSVRRASVSSSSGDGRLDQAARSAVGQWRFAPLPAELPAADSQGTVPVTFWFRKG